MTPKEEDDLRHVPVADYLSAHSHKNGGIKDFLKSNLFAALVIWLLSQALVVGGIVVTLYLKMSSLTEWKGHTEATIDRMDNNGTRYSHEKIEEINKQMATNGTKIDHIEADTSHLDVLESEHRRLTKDVEDLKDAQKHKQ